MEELKRKADVLHQDMQDLRVTVGENTAAEQRLALSYEQLVTRMNRSDRDRKWVVVAVLILAAMVLAGGWVLYRGEQTAREQQQLRSDVLCPLYGLILGGYDPQTRPEGDARQKYEETFVIIRQGYGVLRCTAPLVPPRSDLPNPGNR